MIPPFLYTWRYLTFKSGPTPSSLPPPSSPLIERLFIPTPYGGPLELLHATPPPSTSQDVLCRTPILFCHGGMGSAWVWESWMAALASRYGIESYAVSLRGHGNSWQPSYMRMVFGFDKRDFVKDLEVAAQWVRKEKGDLVLVGHSAGGGLSQYLLQETEVRVKGLALLGAWPGYGGVHVYFNWFLQDPWMTLRHFLHLGHPNSPVSHPTLTRGAFFTPTTPESAVQELHAKISRFESLRWPLSMMSRIIYHPEAVIRKISGWETTPEKTATDRMLVLFGAQDVLMTRPVNEKLARMYQTAAARENKSLAGKTSAAVKGEKGEWMSENGVRLANVENAGHHLQNEPGKPKEEGLKRLVEWYEQL